MPRPLIMESQALLWSPKNTASQPLQGELQSKRAFRFPRKGHIK